MPGKEILGRLKRHEFTGELCAAIFEHDASRSLDPQLHSHCVAANATWDNNRQRWSALTEFEMVHAIRYVGKVYQNDLASRLKAQRRLARTSISRPPSIVNRIKITATSAARRVAGEIQKTTKRKVKRL